MTREQAVEWIQTNRDRQVEFGGYCGSEPRYGLVGDVLFTEFNTPLVVINLTDKSGELLYPRVQRVFALRPDELRNVTTGQRIDAEEWDEDEGQREDEDEDEWDGPRPVHAQDDAGEWDEEGWEDE